MRPRSRVAVWSVIVPIVTLLIGFLFRGTITPAASSQPITPIVVTQIVEKQMPVTQIVEKQVTQIVERPVLVTQLVEVTRVVEVTRFVSQAVSGTPTPNPTPQTAALQFGESFSGQNMILIAKAPRGWCGNGFTGCMFVDFTVENRTGGTLNFDGQTKGFYLDFGAIQRFIAIGNGGSDQTVATFNDFRDRSSRDFGVAFSITLDEFNTSLRNPDVKYFEVVAEGFDPRVPRAVWRQQVLH